MVDLAPVRAFVEEHHLLLAEAARTFAREKLLGLTPANTDDEGRAQAKLVLALLRESGLLRFIDPFDLRACCVIREALAFASPLADEVFALQCLSAMPILLGGSASQREAFARPLIEG